MTHEDIQIIEYSREHAKSISEHLFEEASEKLWKDREYENECSDEVMMAAPIAAIL